MFKLDTTRTVTVLHSFTRGADGAIPYAGLVRDSAGNFYGTTYSGGASGDGVVFKLDTAGTETVLYSFTGADGANPIAGLIRDSAGNLYGTTYYGGAHGGGVAFKLDTAGTETVLQGVKRRVYDEDGATAALHIRLLAGGKRRAGTWGDVGDSGYRATSGASADVYCAA